MTRVTGHHHRTDPAGGFAAVQHDLHRELPRSGDQDALGQVDGEDSIIRTPGLKFRLPLFMDKVTTFDLRAAVAGESAGDGADHRRPAGRRALLPDVEGA